MTSYRYKSVALMLDRNNRAAQSLLLLPLVLLSLPLFKQPPGFLLKGLFDFRFPEKVRQLKPCVVVTALEL
jgi:hypothetical protein